MDPTTAAAAEMTVPSNDVAALSALVAGALPSHLAALASTGMVAQGHQSVLQGAHMSAWAAGHLGLSAPLMTAQTPGGTAELAGLAPHLGALGIGPAAASLLGAGLGMPLPLHPVLQAMGPFGEQQALAALSLPATEPPKRKVRGASSGARSSQQPQAGSSKRQRTGRGQAQQLHSAGQTDQTDTSGSQETGPAGKASPASEDAVIGGGQPTGRDRDRDRDRGGPGQGRRKRSKALQPGSSTWEADAKGSAQAQEPGMHLKGTSSLLEALAIAAAQEAEAAAAAAAAAAPGQGQVEPMHLQGAAQGAAAVAMAVELCPPPAPLVRSGSGGGSGGAAAGAPQKPRSPNARASLEGARLATSPRAAAPLQQLPLPQLPLPLPLPRLPSKRSPTLIQGTAPLMQQHQNMQTQLPPSGFAGAEAVAVAAGVEQKGSMPLSSGLTAGGAASGSPLPSPSFALQKGFAPPRLASGQAGGSGQAAGTRPALGAAAAAPASAPPSSAAAPAPVSTLAHAHTTAAAPVQVSLAAYGSLAVVQGQLSLLYHTYVNSKNVYLEQAKGHLLRLERYKAEVRAWGSRVEGGCCASGADGLSCMPHPFAVAPS